jgi:hypothetical protein
MKPNPNDAKAVQCMGLLDYPPTTKRKKKGKKK